MGIRGNLATGHVVSLTGPFELLHQCAHPLPSCPPALSLRCSILMGIVGNLATGHMVSLTGPFELLHQCAQPLPSCPPALPLLRSILMGILGNLATGHIVSLTGSYQAVFAVTALLYLSSFAAFVVVLRGSPIRLRPASELAASQSKG